MKRELRITEDGSHTIFVPELNEPYHSVHGAIQESKHVFLKHGFQTITKETIRILEIGFGTGLNALLTLAEANRTGKKIYYHAVEKYPLLAQEYHAINYERFIDGVIKGSLIKMHDAEWGEKIRLTSHFNLFKEWSDFRSMEPEGTFDLVYYDAFDPRKQPHLWNEEIFSRISSMVNPGGVFVTYTSKGIVRRALISCDFLVEKVAGPPGKREMIRAIRR
ncbi:MAG: tRNA (5-methylaminomethyl-2-thiouridine)(34)-methyltransferase MnmD [Bacteroidota bacterium]